MDQMSGIRVDPDLDATLKRMNSVSAKQRFAKIEIHGDTLRQVAVGDACLATRQWRDDLGQLPAVLAQQHNHPCFIVFFKPCDPSDPLTTPVRRHPGQPPSVIPILMYYCPPGANSRAKMLYTSAKSIIQAPLGRWAEFVSGGDPAQFSLEAYEQELVGDSAASGDRPDPASDQPRHSGRTHSVLDGKQRSLVFKQRDLDENDVDFIKASVLNDQGKPAHGAQVPDEILAASWNVVYTNSPRTLKRRLVVVSAYRLHLVKKNPLGRHLRHRWPLVILESVTLRKQAETDEMVIQFKKDRLPKMDLQVVLVGPSEKLKPVFQAIMKCSYLLSYGMPESAKPRYHLGGLQSYLDGYKAPDHDDARAVMVGYGAGCDWLRVDQSPLIIDSLERVCQEVARHEQLRQQALGFIDEYVLNFSSLFPDNVVQSQVDAVVAALKSSTLFSRVVVRNYGLRDAGVTAFAPLFANPSILEIHLVNVHASGWDKHMQRIAGALTERNTTLGDVPNDDPRVMRALSFEGNKIGDSALQALRSSLGKLKLRGLNLRDCAFGPKGFKALNQALTGKKLTLTLQTLDVSGCIAKEAGSKYLATYLRNPHCALESLSLAKCQIDAKVVLAALEDNEPLRKKRLRHLDLSGNKIGLKAAESLSNVLRETHVMSDIFLADCTLGKGALHEIIEGVIENQRFAPKVLEFDVDLSGCEIGKDGARDIHDMLSARDVVNVTKLRLARNKLGADGLGLICEAMPRMKMLEVLILDENAVEGVFSGAVDVPHALSRVLECQSLHYLSLAGKVGGVDNSAFLRSALPEFCEKLKTNETLAALNVSGNKLGDAGVVLVSQALATAGAGDRKSALKFIDLDNNKVRAAGICKLAANLQKNKTVCLVLPQNDLKRIQGNVLLRGEKKRSLEAAVESLRFLLKRNCERQGVSSPPNLQAPRAGRSGLGGPPPPPAGPSPRELVMRGVKPPEPNDPIPSDIQAKYLQGHRRDVSHSMSESDASSILFRSVRKPKRPPPSPLANASAPPVAAGSEAAGGADPPPPPKDDKADKADKDSSNGDKEASESGGPEPGAPGYWTPNPDLNEGEGEGDPKSPRAGSEAPSAAGSGANMPLSPIAIARSSSGSGSGSGAGGPPQGGPPPTPAEQARQKAASDASGAAGRPRQNFNESAMIQQKERELESLRKSRADANAQQQAAIERARLHLTQEHRRLNEERMLDQRRQMLGGQEQMYMGGSSASWASGHSSQAMSPQHAAKMLQQQQQQQHQLQQQQQRARQHGPYVPQMQQDPFAALGAIPSPFSQFGAGAAGGNGFLRAFPGSPTGQHMHPSHDPAGLGSGMPPPPPGGSVSSAAGAQHLAQRQQRMQQMQQMQFQHRQAHGGMAGIGGYSPLASPSTEMQPPPFDADAALQMQEDDDEEDGYFDHVAMVWYYTDLGYTRVGPVSRDDFKAAWLRGECNADSLCWTDSMEDWWPVKDIPDLAQFFNA